MGNIKKRLASSDAAVIQKRYGTLFGFKDASVSYMKLECDKKTISYFYVEALESGVTVQFYYMANTGDNHSEIGLSYSADANNWVEWNCSDVAGYQLFDRLMMVKAGDRIYIKGDNSETWTQQENVSYTDIHFTITGRCNLGGSLGSLIDGDNYNDGTAGLMYGMFRENPGITDISELYIPNGVFANAHGCESMFSGCDGITRSADMPNVTVIGDYACYGMYYSCDNLVTAADMPSLVSVGRGGCQQMYSDCALLSSSAHMPDLVTISDYGCSGMYNDCVSLVSASDMPSLTTMGDNACERMYGSCESLSSAADMPSLTTIGDNACSGMYYNCEKLTLISGRTLTFDFPAPPVTTTGGTTYETVRQIAEWMSDEYNPLIWDDEYIWQDPYVWQ